MTTLKVWNPDAADTWPSAESADGLVPASARFPTFTTAMNRVLERIAICFESDYDRGIAAANEELMKTAGCETLKNIEVRTLTRMYRKCLFALIRTNHQKRKGAVSHVEIKD